MKNFKMFFCVLLFCATSFSGNSEELIKMNNLKPWEKLGITSKEYKVARENNLTNNKIKYILCHGISIERHLLAPWEPLNITEKQWYKQTRLGKNDIEIRQWADNHNRDRILFRRIRNYFRKTK